MHGVLCMTALGELCCVVLSSSCVVLPYLAFLSISWMIKVMYILGLVLGVFAGYHGLLLHAKFDFTCL